jgi:alkylation response protein AidB-like acyl-CoA dehydrogenase
MQTYQNLSQRSQALTWPLSNESVIADLKTAVKQELLPQVKNIDQKGEYPQGFMHRIGELGGFGQTVPKKYLGSEQGIKGAIQAIETVSEACVNTGFITWCQIACAWYIQNSENSYLRQCLLPEIATGKTLAGTGLSNPMKHFADIEKISLSAERCSGGYIINGMLPWVSNIASGHYFAIAARMTDSDQYLMAIVSDALENLSLRANAKFIALEGSSTFSCIFRDVFVPDELILAAPCENYVSRIQPGFILTQVGMGLGLVSSCIDLIQRANKQLGHVNQFLDDEAENLTLELEAARRKTYALAAEIESQQEHLSNDFLKEVIQARLTGSDLSMRAAKAAMLHGGARAFLLGNPMERKMRESYFIAIVTPAVKHLKKMLSRL